MRCLFTIDDSYSYSPCSLDVLVQYFNFLFVSITAYVVTKAVSSRLVHGQAVFLSMHLCSNVNASVHCFHFHHLKISACFLFKFVFARVQFILLLVYMIFERLLQP